MAETIDVANNTGDGRSTGYGCSSSSFTSVVAATTGVGSCCWLATEVVVSVSSVSSLETFVDSSFKAMWQGTTRLSWWYWWQWCDLERIEREDGRGGSTATLTLTPTTLPLHVWPGIVTNATLLSASAASVKKSSAQIEFILCCTVLCCDEM